MQAIAKIGWLRVTTGKEAMSLLLTSERVYTDMIDWLKYGEPEQVIYSLTQLISSRLFLENGTRIFH